jgi:hypothetical protein
MQRWHRSSLIVLFLLTAILVAVSRRLAELAMPIGPIAEPSRAMRASDACRPEENSDFVAVGGDQSVWSWYQLRLAYMAEPMLACGPTFTDETYRFTWMHAFTTRDPLSVRVARRGKRVSLVGRRYRWHGGPTRLTVESTVERTLTNEEWDTVKRAVSSGLWNIPGYKNSDGNDGATWMTEGRNGTGYHLVTRWEPTLAEERSVGNILLRLAGFTLPK